jgi:hypothetical protein
MTTGPKPEIGKGAPQSTSGNRIRSWGEEKRRNYNEKGRIYNYLELN